MKLDFQPETKRIICDMSKEEAWALLEALDCIVDRKPICIAKEYRRAFGAMQRKDARRNKDNPVKEWFKVIKNIK